MTQKTVEPTVAQPSQAPPPQRGQASGCLLRVYWMLLGNVLVAVFAFRIAQEPGGSTATDVAYWLAAAGLLAARFVDVAYRAGQTADGQPATMQDFKRYALGVLAATVVLWLAVRFLI